MNLLEAVDERIRCIIGSELDRIEASITRRLERILEERVAVEPERWLSVAQVADRIGRSRASVHRYITEGRLEATNATGRLLVSESALGRFMRGGR